MQDFFRPEVSKKFVLLKSHYAGAWRDPGMERSQPGADDIEELPELSLYPSHVCKREMKKAASRLAFKILEKY
ncbi:hypothetical protein A4V04_07430 [Burkholderiales bacterium YL45]|uniref:Uncharacterized protein n=1 Tax=Turicimonas muris TaxID=1796652 RepID=A0A227KB29_9BURK|nr:hypothetical protein A4V04_07430 [Burkholderiales bacterium YL45]OXE44439.1 hypothetical protein ADH67_11965 [Turicimonas muris]